MSRKKSAKEGDKSGSKPPLAQVFTTMLLHWDQYENVRKMPWKGEKDPYKVWLSEIILQQTRVEQGLKYYENFIRTFPTIAALASAPETRVFKLWEGLGYYSRCRNLIQTARFIHEEAGGRFPNDLTSLLQLKGVGPYTAAAIASFSFDLPHAVVDGNVFRVLSRIFDLDTPVDSTEGRKQFTALAQALLPVTSPGKYNQAIMDFGATICKPVPECGGCFFNAKCPAYKNGRQDLLPVKEKQVNIRERWLYYFVLIVDNKLAIRKREGKDIWQQLHEFPLVEVPKAIDQQELLSLFKKQYGVGEFMVGDNWETRQKLTHQQLHLYFLQIHGKNKNIPSGFAWIPIQDLRHIAFPRSLQQYLQRFIW